jgi:hypothetical protein
MAPHEDMIVRYIVAKERRSVHERVMVVELDIEVVSTGREGIPSGVASPRYSTRQHRNTADRTMEENRLQHATYRTSDSAKLNQYTPFEQQCYAVYKNQDDRQFARVSGIHHSTVDCVLHNDLHKMVVGVR